MIPAMLMLVICMMALVKFQGNQIRLITCYTCIYLIMLTVMQEMDLSFTIYLIFVTAAFLPIKNVSLHMIIYFFYMIIYTSIGLVYQEFWNTASVLLTRYGFLFLGLIMCKKRQKSNFLSEKDYLFVLRWGTVTEVLLAIYLSFSGDLENRLTINSQAIGGSISVGVLPFICILYFMNYEMWKKKRMYRYLVIHLAIIVLSGTRGYMVMGFLTVVPMFFSILKKQFRYRKRFILMSFGGGLAIVLFLSSHWIQNKVGTLLRLKESVGYRVYENIFIRKIFVASPWLNKLLGFGLGGRAEGVNGYSAIVVQSAQGKSWMVSKLMTETTVHNYWYTILFKQGLIGLLLCGIVMITIFYKIFQTYKSSKQIFWTLALLFLGNIISITFRISSTCGVWEMVVMLWFAQKFNWRRVEKESYEKREKT